MNISTPKEIRIADALCKLDMKEPKQYAKFIKIAELLMRRIVRRQRRVLAELEAAKASLKKI